MLVVVAVAGGCPSEGGGVFSCVYEKRSSVACNSPTLSAWSSECSTVDFEIRDDLTPQTFCDLVYPPTDTECAAGCCIDFEFRNVSAVSGPCNG